MMTKPVRRYIKNSLNYVKPKEAYDPADLLARARSFDPERLQAKDALITHFTPLAMAIACRWASKFPNKDLDILSEALLALAAGVASAVADRSVKAEVLSARLHLTIRGAITSYVTTDSDIKIPADSPWFREKVKTTEGDHYNTYMPSINDPNMRIDRGNDTSFNNVFIRDILAHRVLMPIERDIITLCVDGYDDREIAKSVNLSAARVGQIRKEAGKKIKKIIKGEL